MNLYIRHLVELTYTWTLISRATSNASMCDRWDDKSRTTCNMCWYTRSRGVPKSLSWQQTLRFGTATLYTTMPPGQFSLQPLPCDKYVICQASFSSSPALWNEQLAACCYSKMTISSRISYAISPDYSGRGATDPIVSVGVRASLFTAHPIPQSSAGPCRSWWQIHPQAFVG